jgi:hypothetical protein
VLLLVLELLQLSWRVQQVDVILQHLQHHTDENPELQIKHQTLETGNEQSPIWWDTYHGGK